MQGHDDGKKKGTATTEATTLHREQGGLFVHTHAAGLHRVRCTSGKQATRQTHRLRHRTRPPCVPPVRDVHQQPDRNQRHERDPERRGIAATRDRRRVDAKREPARRARRGPLVGRDRVVLRWARSMSAPAFPLIDPTA